MSSPETRETQETPIHSPEKNKEVQEGSSNPHISPHHLVFEPTKTILTKESYEKTRKAVLEDKDNTHRTLLLHELQEISPLYPHLFHKRVDEVFEEQETKRRRLEQQLEGTQKELAAAKEDIEALRRAVSVTMTYTAWQHGVQWTVRYNSGAGEGPYKTVPFLDTNTLLSNQDVALLANHRTICRLGVDQLVHLLRGYRVPFGGDSRLALRDKLLAVIGAEPVEEVNKTRGLGPYETVEYIGNGRRVPSAELKPLSSFYLICQLTYPQLRGHLEGYGLYTGNLSVLLLRDRLLQRVGGLSAKTFNALRRYGNYFPVEYVTGERLTLRGYRELQSFHSVRRLSRAKLLRHLKGYGLDLPVQPMPWLWYSLFQAIGAPAGFLIHEISLDALQKEIVELNKEVQSLERTTRYNMNAVELVEVGGGGESDSESDGDSEEGVRVVERVLRRRVNGGRYVDGLSTSEEDSGEEGSGEGGGDSSQSVEFRKVKPKVVVVVKEEVKEEAKEEVEPKEGVKEENSDKLEKSETSSKMKKSGTTETPKEESTTASPKSDSPA